MPLPASTTLGVASLRIADLERSLAFYHDGLGLRLLERDRASALLGDEGQPVIQLRAVPGLAAADPRAAGLFHLAVLYPDRTALATVVRHLVTERVRFSGASDHRVSEAFYLDDPDGNGVELYRDRPAESWPRDADGSIAMATLPLDIESVLAEADTEFDGAAHGTRLGHVHLQVGDLARAERFYREVIGLDLMTRYGSEALFLAAGGYHHHLGLNVWRTRGRAPATRAQAGLDAFELVLPDAASVAAVVTRAEAAGVSVRRSDAGTHVEDPDGVEVVLREA